MSTDDLFIVEKCGRLISSSVSNSKGEGTIISCLAIRCFFEVIVLSLQAWHFLLSILLYLINIKNILVSDVNLNINMNQVFEKVLDWRDYLNDHNNKRVILNIHNIREKWRKSIKNFWFYFTKASSLLINV